MAICSWCGGDFTPKRASRASFCSRRCAGLATAAKQRALPKPAVPMTVCGCGCGGPMPVYDAHGRIRRYLYRHNPPTRPLVECPQCGETFRRRRSAYCSRTCASAATRGRVELTCAVCSRSYWQHEYRADASRYCSKACWSARAPRVQCEGCEETFAHHRDRGAGRFCSRACAHRTMVGPLATRYVDGQSMTRDRAREQPRLREWRRAVMTRDGFRCVLCSATGYLHAHHMFPWALYPALRFDVDNGVTLCDSCHGDVHGRRLTHRRRRGGRTSGPRRSPAPRPDPVPEPGSATYPRTRDQVP